MNRTIITTIFSCILFFTSCLKDDNLNTQDQDSNWTQLGISFDSEIYDLVADNNGLIYMSGGNIPNIMVWDGTEWKILGGNQSVFTGGLIWPIAVDNDGNVYARGMINVPQANDEIHLAKWVKSTNTWINLTSNNPFEYDIKSIAADNDGNVFVSSVDYGSNGWVYKWNGNNWDLLSTESKYKAGLGKMCINYSGTLLASFYNTISNSYCVLTWNGISWAELGGTDNTDFGVGSINCIASDSKGNVYVGGYFVKGNAAFNIYKWTPLTNTWEAIYTHGSSSDVYSITFDTADTLFVAGAFVNASNKHYVAKQQGDKWADYGSLNANNNIKSICFDKNGYMYAGGSFTNSENKYYISINREKY